VLYLWSFTFTQSGGHALIFSSARFDLAHLALCARP